MGMWKFNEQGGWHSVLIFYVIMMPLNVNGCFRILSCYITGNILFSDFIIPFNIKNSKIIRTIHRYYCLFCHIY